MTTIMARAVPWLIPILVLLIWQAGSALGVIQANVLPAPSAVAAAGWHLARSGELWTNIEVSAARALFGFAIGGGIGFALGMANGLSSLSETLTDSTLQMVRNIPHLALIPLVILWFGIDEEAKVFLVALGVFFPTLCEHAAWRALGRSASAGDGPCIRHDRAQRCSCALCCRARCRRSSSASATALGIMWLTLIVAETISAIVRHRLHGNERARIHAGRRRGVLHPGLRRARQACRQHRADAGA